ncbi:MAG: AarF/UbiB family protein [Thermoactinomyces sp.]
MNDFRLIIVKKGKKVVKIKNPTQLELIGKGAQGAVFRLSEDRCIKIYAKEKNCLRESEALYAAQDSSIVPKVYEVGSNYIVMEYIKGQPLKDYLRSLRFIPESIAKQLLFIFKEMKRIGFTRIDNHIRHFIVTDDGVIKVVDHVNSLIKESPWPVLFFGALAKLKLLNSFLYQLKEMDPELYWEWKNSWAKRKNKK